MKSPPITLAEFGQFTIRQVAQHADHAVVSGEITKPGRFSCGQQIMMFVRLYDELFAIVIELNPDARTAALRVNSKTLHPALISGATLPICDSNWMGKLHLVLDSAICWTRVEYIARDSFSQPSESGARMWRLAIPTDKERTDGEIVPGGWDHEHCEICWQKIGSGGDREGYVTGAEEWVCVACYFNFIEPRDLRFVMGNAWEDSDASADLATHLQRINQLIDEYDLPALRRYLTDNGGVNIRSKSGLTLLMLAASRGHQSLFSLLLDAGANADTVSEEPGFTALALAAQKGRVQMVEKLLALCAKVQVPETLCGGSLLSYVKTGPGGGNPRIAELLMQAG